MDGPATRDSSARIRRRRCLRVTAGYLVSLVCLAWLLHDVDLGEIQASARGLEWAFVGLAVIADILSYAIQGWRWKVLLRPVGLVSWFDATRAIYTGLFASEILPMRPGEMVRGYVISRSLGATIAAVIPSMVVERLCDAFWMALGLGIAAMVVPLPPNLAEAVRLLGLVTIAATCGFAYIVVHLRPGEPLTRADARGWKLVRMLASSLRQFASGLRAIGLSRAMWSAFALSFAFLGSQVGAMWLMMHAFRLPLSIWAAGAVLLIVHLGTAVPNAPANVGTYQLFTVIGLSLFGVEKPIAVAFSVIAFLVLTVPLWVLGYAALIGANLSLRSVWRTTAPPNAARVRSV